jgi:phosphate-selective porin OprO/OprP
VVAAPVLLSSGERVNFSGYYAAVAYFLTGEYIPYNTEYAITDRVRPNKPVFRRRSEGGALIVGPGAWQIASRISHVDLDSGSVSGGRLTDATFGLNWFLTPNHRMKFNYILSNLNRENIASQASIFGLRFDMDF